MNTKQTKGHLITRKQVIITSLVTCFILMFLDNVSCLVFPTNSVFDIVTCSSLLIPDKHNDTAIGIFRSDDGGAAILVIGKQGGITLHADCGSSFIHIEDKDSTTSISGAGITR